MSTDFADAETQALLASLNGFVTVRHLDLELRHHKGAERLCLDFEIVASPRRHPWHLYEIIDNELKARLDNTRTVASSMSTETQRAMYIPSLVGGTLHEFHRRYAFDGIIEESLRVDGVVFKASQSDGLSTSSWETSRQQLDVVFQIDKESDARKLYAEIASVIAGVQGTLEAVIDPTHHTFVVTCNTAPVPTACHVVIKGAILLRGGNEGELWRADVESRWWNSERSNAKE